MGEKLIVGRLLTPSFALWYILSLVYWRVLLSVTPCRFLDQKWVVIITTIAISVGSGFVPLSTEMSFQRACGFLPFFFLGYYARQEGWVDKLRLWNKSIFALLFVFICALCYLYLPVFYSKDSYNNIAEAGVRLFQLGIAVLLCVSVLNITPKTLGRFTNVGRYTLMIYLLHPPLIKVMNMACGYVGIDRSPLIAVAMTAIIIILIYSIRNLKVLRYLQ